MDEDIFIPLIVFSFFLAMTWMILNYRKWKLTHKQETRPTTDNSMGLSELEAMMREAVDDRTEPLLDRIEALEEALARAEAPRLMPAQREDRIEERNPAPARQAEPAEPRP